MGAGVLLLPSFALAMDHTAFLLTSVRAEYERTGNARVALVEGPARSGRVINAAGAVMIVVFFTFGLSRPLPPKEMGVILDGAVLLDTMLVRLLLLPAVLRLHGKPPGGPLADRPMSELANHGRCTSLRGCLTTRALRRWVSRPP